jgi:cytochrome c-550 PedF
MKTLIIRGALALGLAAGAAIALSPAPQAHGDVTPQAVNTEGLDKLGADWKATNPYRGNAKAIEIGKSGYNQNCARCHGLDAISGGIAPDLRFLESGEAGDEWFQTRVRNGAVRDGKVYMPKFGDALGQEALWAIRSWLDTVHVE